MTRTAFSYKALLPRMRSASENLAQAPSREPKMGHHPSFWRRSLLALLGLSLLASPVMVPQAQARVYVEINQASRQPFPLAIPVFKNLGKNADPDNISEQLADMVVADLRLTGLFNLLDRKAYIEDPAKAGIMPEQFDFANWKQVDALGLVKAGFVVTGSTVKIETRIYDVLATAQIGGKTYENGSVRDLRRIAHRIASDIVFQFTGERGFFMSRITAVSSATGNKEIVVMDADGKGQMSLSSNKSINLLPAWSPRGDKIAYTSYKNGNPDLYVADLVRGVTKKVSAAQGINSGAAFSPDGKSIALTMSKDGDPEIYVIDLEGKEIARLTKSYGVDSSPAWSPDGKKVAFVSARAGGAHVFVMNKDGSNVKRLTYAGSQNVSPAWSPKGDKIVFTGRDQGAFDVFVMNADGSNITRITQDSGDNEDPCFSPDGNYVLYASSRNGRSPNLYISSVDGRSQVRVTEGNAGYTNPDWSGFVEW